MVAFELEIIAKKLDRFGWERDRGSPAHDRVVMDWMDAMQDYPLAEVREACAMHLRAFPNKMPNEGHIRVQLDKLRKARAEAFKASNPRPAEDDPRETMTPERFREVCDELGLQLDEHGRVVSLGGPKRMGGAG